MDVLPAVAIAVCFLWLGMVLAISFIEAPLKFQAPGVTLQIGLGIGRLVFLALNAVETVCAAGLLGVLIAAGELWETWPASAAVAALAVQLAAVRPQLAKRANAVLAGDDDGSRSKAHLGYVVLEIVKVLALIGAGIVLIGG